MSEPQKPKSYRLQFTDEERASPELDKYIKKSEKAADRYDKASAAIPKKNKLVKERTFDEATGKAKTRLHFEKQDKPPSDARGKHKSPLRPVAQAELYVHGKIHEVEKDNSGVEAAHKSEELAEGAAKYGARKLKEGYHSHKLKPYRAAAKAEKAAIKANAEFKYQKALQDNPQIAASNPFSRFMQKQRIKREYAKAAKKGGIKSAKKTAENAGKAAKKTAQTTKNTVSFVARHWKGVLIGICALLLFVIISAGVTSCVSLLTGGMSTVVGSSYVAEDADMLGAEADYKSKEAADILQILKYIEENYKNSILSEEAKLLHYDFYWLSHEIKNRTGKTYTELLQDKRLSQAAYLLKSTKIGVDEISKAVGYENKSYFHRIFAKQFGMSPKKYRDLE